MDEKPYYYKCIVSYLGSNFNGWQSQAKDSTKEPVPNIQGSLQQCLYELIGSKDCIVAGCSRTDSGVHAWKQMLRLSIPVSMDKQKLMNRLNKLLPKDIRILSCELCDESFTPGSTKSLKTYRYYFCYDKVINPLVNDFVTWVAFPLDIDLLKEGLKLFEGEKDFTNFFLSSSDSPSAVRNIHSAKLIKWNDPIGCNEIFYFEFSGEGFLKQMIRIIVANLFLLGRSTISIEDIKQRLGSKYEQPKIKAAPARGLHLVDIKFFE